LGKIRTDNKLIKNLTALTVGMGKNIILLLVISVTIISSTFSPVYSSLLVDYRYEIVVDNGTMIDGELFKEATDPSLNNEKRGVVFEGDRVVGNDIISTLTDTIAKEGDIIDGKTLNLSPSDPDMNDFGVVVFDSRFNDGVDKEAIFTQTKLIAAEGDIIDGKTLTDVNDPSINNAGTVVFEGRFF